MTTTLEIVGAFLSTATMLTAAIFVAALRLGHLITCDDQQRRVEVPMARRAAAHEAGRRR